MEAKELKLGLTAKKKKKKNNKGICSQGGESSRRI